MAFDREHERDGAWQADERRAFVKFLIFSTLIVFSLIASSFSIGQVDNSTHEEYEVLSALLNEIYLTGNYKSIVITNPTCCEVEDGYVRSGAFKMYLDQLDPVSFETLDDFAARNKTSLTFETKFKLRTNYAIVPFAEVEK